MPTKTEAAAMEKLLREVEVLTTLVDTVEHGKMETWAKVNALGGRMDKIIETVSAMLAEREESR